LIYARLSLTGLVLDLGVLWPCPDSPLLPYCTGGLQGGTYSISYSCSGNQINANVRGDRGSDNDCWKVWRSPCIEAVCQPEFPRDDTATSMSHFRLPCGNHSPHIRRLYKSELFQFIILHQVWSTTSTFISLRLHDGNLCVLSLPISSDPHSRAFAHEGVAASAAGLRRPGNSFFKSSFHFLPPARIIFHAMA
jgi:hypothetical protein